MQQPLQEQNGTRWGEEKKKGRADETKGERDILCCVHVGSPAVKHVPYLLMYFWPYKVL